nr:ribonuclease H-like domain-containing protein [Tanacetum cinerariifolium]
MVTRFCVRTNRLTERLNLHVSSVSLLPKSYRDAFNDLNWKNAMCDEYNVLIKNKTWTLVPRPSNTNIVRCMWLFRHKYLADGSLSHYKARLMANGSTQLEGVDKKYVVEILERAHIANCNPSRTPIDTKSKSRSDGDPDSDLTLYRSLADPDWASCPTTRSSTLGYCVFLGNNLLSWSSKRQPTLSRFNAKAKYRGVTNVVAETCWLPNSLRELHTPLSSTMLVYCDNVSVVYLSCNPVQHQRTKHIEIDIHFVRDLAAAGQVRVLHVSSRYQFANIFTKGLPSALFEELRTSLSIRCPPAPTAEECKWVNSDGVFFMINIYGPQESIDKIAMWNRMLEFNRNHDDHFVIFGDLNEFQDETERYGTEFSRPVANRDGFDECIKMAYNECLLINPHMPFHEKMKERIRRLMHGSAVTKQQRHSRFVNEFDKFVAVEGESLTSVYERITTLVNFMDRNEIRPLLISINTKFLNSLQPEWSKYVTMCRQNVNLKEVDYDHLFDTLSQYEPHVNASKAKKATRNHDPLALTAHSHVHCSHSHASPSYSHSPQPYYVTHPSSVIDYKEDYQGELQGYAQEDKRTTTMMMLAREIT